MNETAESLIYGVPEPDTGFAELPAQEHFHAAEQGRKIDQSGIQVLDDAAQLLHLFDDGAQPRSGGVAK